MNILEHLPEESLFHDWVDAWPTAEPPKSFILFSAMAMLGAALGRKVFFDQDAHTLYPMLNLLLIGPSGIGKSTSLVKLGFPLIYGLNEDLRPNIIGGKATPEKLHEDLVQSPHSIIFASELANFFSKAKYMEDMIPYVTQLLDYEKTVERRTKGSNLQVIQSPSVTIVGGSTVEWLQGQLPDSAASGGFLARFLIVKEDHKGQRVADPKNMFSEKRWAQIEQLRERTLRRFNNCVADAGGPITYFDYGARDEYGLWYQTYMPETGALSPFSARAGEFVLRLAMLVAISCGRYKVTDLDIRSAIKLHGYASAKLAEVVVPFTPQGKAIAQVLQSVGEHPTSALTIKRALRNSMAAADVERILQSLLETQDITKREERNAKGEITFVTYQRKR